MPSYLHASSMGFHNVNMPYLYAGWSDRQRKKTYRSLGIDFNHMVDHDIHGFAVHGCKKVHRRLQKGK